MTAQMLVDDRGIIEHWVEFGLKSAGPHTGLIGL